MSKNTAATKHTNHCFASAPVDGIVDRCTLPMHFSGKHVGALHTWSPIEDDADLFEEHRPFRGVMPRPGLATEDVLVAPPSARVVS